jgi:ornithine--oxo-acid transaminase
VRALHDALDADLPNLVQMDCSLLPGVLAEALVRRSHSGIERVCFTNSGAEAVESAIKFARAATKRTRILYCDHAFHGLTTGALALNGGREFRGGFGPLLPGVDMIPFGDIGALGRELRKGDVAAFVVEPIQGKGVNLAPGEFWPEAQALCRRYKALMVLDEVQAGLGRTGTLFCHQQFGITPDIITVSKALSGGYVPVGAMLTTAAVSDAVFSSLDRAVVHSSTFAANQLAMVAGLATLAAFDDEDILDRVQRTGKAFTKALAPLVERYEFLHEVRGMGLMIGLVFGEPTTPSLRRRFRVVEAMRPALFSQMMVVPLFHRHRILTQVAADNMNVVKLLPPLIAGDDEVELFTDALDDVLGSAERGSSLLFEFGKTMAKGTLHRSRL